MFTIKIKSNPPYLYSGLDSKYCTKSPFKRVETKSAMTNKIFTANNITKPLFFIA